MFRKFEKITIRWINLSTFRATDPGIINISVKDIGFERKGSESFLCKERQK